MKSKVHKIVNANQAVAQMAYKTNEVLPIYPITPASEMSELVEEWSALNHQNIFKSVPTTFEMQSEAGVAGAMHGALQTGSLSATFTASQGLLLMLPNMYKIAGELTPNVIHVATRSVATHALSVFGDHSDVMAVRQSGYAFLASASVQEAQDFALIAQTATLKSKVPFLHFFDGFRTSHELHKIEAISDSIIHEMIDETHINEHRNRALNPNKPVLRGTSQGSDVFFQSREAVNSHYTVCPNIVQDEMDKFSKLTGRTYQLFDYVGDPNATQLIIAMASGTETIEETVLNLNKKGKKFGLIKVRLFRPFSIEHLLKALPKTVQSIAVLDRTKEAGSTGEPLYLDIVQSVTEAYQNNQVQQLPRIIGGRFGLSSKEFTPNMVYAIFNNLSATKPKNNFTVGINDDVTHLSLDFAKEVEIEAADYQAIFYNKKSTNSSKNLSALLDFYKESASYLQGYIACDYKKSNSRNVGYFRMSSKPIKAPYLIQQADFVFCHHHSFITADNTLRNLKPNGILLVDTPLTSDALWQKISANKQQEFIEKNVDLYIVNSSNLKPNYLVKNKKIALAHACFLILKNDLINFEYKDPIKSNIHKVTTSVKEVKEIESINDFNQTLLGKLLKNKGNDVFVSQVPVDGTFSTDTSGYNMAVFKNELPVWNADACTQCGACSLACPQAAIRPKVFDNSYLKDAPFHYKSIKTEEITFDLLNYALQVNPDQCNGCSNCLDACPIKEALQMKQHSGELKEERENWTYFESIPEFDRAKIDVTKISQQQLQEPLFKYSIGVEGCGEAPYLKLMSQLFGDRLLVANATGASSIFGGALPTTPWSKNDEGRGPAWSNSLFEDNAEFGLGYRLSLDQQEKEAKNLLLGLWPRFDIELVDSILKTTQNSEYEIAQQRIRVAQLKDELKLQSSKEAKRLLTIVDSLVKKSVWIVGGDGWAYDIGYGGLDHVISSGKNVNILVLDNEVYDNTGGQASKATPFGAKARFAHAGKTKQKKDLGLMAMNYDNVYVASVAIGADQEQTLRAFNEAESYDGPSIIIAYCHSKSHGINMKNPSQYHKAAVASGQWILYRNDPRKSDGNQNTFFLDSEKPSIRIEDYLKLEKRFTMLFKQENQFSSMVLEELQQHIFKKYERYQRMTYKTTDPNYSTAD